MTATVIRSVTILGICLDIIRAQGRLWITARDLAMVLGYKCESSVRQAYYRHRKHESIQGHVIKIFVGGYPHGPCRLFDEVAVAFFCHNRKREGAFELLRWIDAGGLSFGQPPLMPEIETPPIEAVKLLPPPRHLPSLRLVPRGPDPMQQLLERDKAYCRDLVKTLLRYCDAGEVDKLTLAIDEQIDHLLESRYCPGLNAACYELYRKYWLQGGEA